MAIYGTTLVGENVIEIPGEPDFFKTVNLPSELVPLPLAVGTRFQLMAIFAGLLGLLLSVGGLLLLLGLPSINWSVWEIVAMGAIGLFTLAGGICFIGAALTAMTDGSTWGPIIVIDDTGILDRRSVSNPVAWPDIAHAKVIYTKVGVAGVFLKLRRRIEARQNPFRLGTLGFLWRRQPDELYVPLMGLDAKPRLLALSITTLVQRNGGAIDTKHPYAGTAL